MGCALYRGVEDKDVDGVGFKAVPVCGGTDYGSLEDTWQALCTFVNFEGHVLQRLEGTMYHRLPRVEAVFQEVWTDGNGQQNSQIWLIRLLTTSQS